MKNKTFNKTTINAAITAALFAGVTTAQASDNTAKVDNKSEIENIVVTANRTPQEQFTALSATEIINQEQIKLIQPQNISELLDKVAGISVVSQGAGGANSSVFVRGSNSNQTLILVDGVRTNSATLGSTNLSAISPAQVDRIEIVKGPRAALWGADAIGGVIQIFTKQQQPGEGSVSATYGSHSYGNVNGSIGLGNEQHALTITAAAEKSDGYSATDFDGQEDDDGFERKSISVVGLSKITEQLSVDLVGRYEDGQSDYDNEYGGNDEKETENYSAKVGANYQAKQWLTQASLSTSQDQSNNFKSGTDKNLGSDITTERDQFSLLGQYSFSSLTSITAGYDWYIERVSTKNDLDSWTDGYQEYDKDSRVVNAAYIQARHQIQAFLFEGAVRHDDIQGIDGETTYNISAGYQVSDEWLLSLNQSTGFKAPTFNDLYYPGSGNLDLIPEESISNEILVRHQSEFLSAELSVFDSEIDNLIVWDIDLGTGFWAPSNVDADIQGIELSLHAETGDFSHLLAMAYIKSEDSYTGKELFRRPEKTVNYNLAYQWQALTSTAIVTYRGDSLDVGGVVLESYELLDLSFAYQATNDLSINVKLNNVFDRSYTTATNYLNDGSNYELNATYHF